MATGFVLPVIAIAVGVAILMLRKRNLRGSASLVVFSAALITWACAYAILLYSSAHNAHSDGRLWLALITLSATVTSTALLTFIIAYTNHAEWLGRWVLLLLCLEPLTTQALFWTSRWQAYFSSAYVLTNSGIF